MQKQGGVIHQRHQNNNKAGTSTSLLKSRCFDKSLNSASDPRAMGRFRVRVRQERMLRLSSGFCRSSPCNSPIPRHWPFLCYFHCCSQWDGAHSYPTPRLDPVPGSPAGCTTGFKGKEHTQGKKCSECPPWLGIKAGNNTPGFRSLCPRGAVFSP